MRDGEQNDPQYVSGQAEQGNRQRYLTSRVRGEHRERDRTLLHVAYLIIHRFPTGSRLISQNAMPQITPIHAQTSQPECRRRHDRRIADL